ncbi:MAG: glycosyltransferase family 2 protein [Bacteroidales bacterium]|nr:glycosyltransferase family 2 protein [Bacteroidales bacterium]
MIYIFWILLFIIFYSYLGYPILLLIFNLPKRIFYRDNKSQNKYEPEITLFVAAYNEADFIEQKISNSLNLNYPKDKIKYVWVTDGSCDETPSILSKYNEFIVLHNKERNGKTGAINRGMKFIKTPIVIFSDANTNLNKNAIIEIVNQFKDPKVGCVAGEKRIAPQNKDNAVNSGEGIYWKYESFLKKNESIFNSTIGAVGELFAIKTELFEEIESDTILDDFIISLRIAQKGYKIKYTPEAYATERASANINEELKRKNRIAYGGFQAISRLKSLLNPFKNPILSFQYISHKLLRWTLVPVSIFLLFFVNLYLSINNNWNSIFAYIFYLQVIFYLFVLLGYLMQSIKTRFKIIFAPYYLFIMNISEIIGFIRFLRKKQTVNWEKAKRE